jgi:predicted DNA-binding WGR domain protein
MAAKRRFELVEGTSKKFWEIAVQGASHTVRFGRIGTDGQSKAKTFASDEAARRDADKLVKEKLGKGYREIAVAAPAPAAKAEPAVRTTLKPPRGRRPIVLTLAGARVVIDDVAQELASAAQAKRHVDEVVRARLQEGYTLGSVDIVADEAPEQEEYVHEEPEPEAEPATVERDEHGRWRVTFEGDRAPDAKACRALAARIREEAPRVVQLVCDFASPGAAWAEGLARAQLPSVKDVIFDTYFQTQTRQRENSIGDLRATLDACPSLERLFATGALAITKGSHERLRELYVLGDPLSPELLRTLAKWRLPSLELLVVSIASDAGPGDDDDASAVALLTGLDAPKLRTVHVDSLEDVQRVLGELVASGRVRAWKELRLSGGIDEDALLDVVRRNVDVLRALDVLGLPLGDDLSSDGDEELRALCPSVRDLSELPELTLPAAYDSWRGA